MQFITLPWATLQAIYRAKNGEVVEGKYVRVAGHFINLWDPSNEGYAVTDTQYLAGTFYSGVVPN